MKDREDKHSDSTEAPKPAAPDVVRVISLENNATIVDLTQNLQNNIAEANSRLANATHARLVIQLPLQKSDKAFLAAYTEIKIKQGISRKDALQQLTEISDKLGPQWGTRRHLMGKADVFL